MSIFRRKRKGRIVLVFRGRETVIGRSSTPGTMKLVIDTVEVDAEWMLNRLTVSTHSD